MSRRPLDRAEAQAALQRVLDLPTRDQFEVFAALRDYLGGEFGEDDLHEQIDQRRQALEAIRAVAEHLKLEAGQAPTSTQFREAAPTVAPGWNVTRVQRAFGRWRLAQRAFAGERVRESPAQREQRRRQSGRRRSHDEAVAGVREWLASKPKSEDQPTYDDWVAAENERRDLTGALPLIKADSVKQAVGLPWSNVLEVARGEISLRKAREKRAKTLGQGRLAGLTYASYLLGCSQTQAQFIAQRDEFPNPVAKIGGSRAWERADLEAYAQGRATPQRTLNEAQAELVEAADLADELDLDQGYLRTLVSRKRWDRVPPPSGQVGHYNYWWRKEVEAWVQGREEDDE